VSSGGNQMPRRATLTLADLVVLSLLAERPMHGYEMWAELARRQVEKWAGVSRPQVYYSLRKLDAAGHIETARDPDQALGPERRVYRPTVTGRRALADALARERWATQRSRPAFLTWMVMSWQARPRDVYAQLARRRRFLERELKDGREALRAIVAETSPTSDAAMIVTLTIAQLETELQWLDDVEKRHRPG
jgi:DNA-binding PadR family transcriptional regulator